MTTLDWRQRLYTFEELRQFAAVRGDMPTAVAFLKSVQVMPYDVERIPAPDYVNTNLDPHRIPAGYLAALAYEWDKDGAAEGSAREFIESFRPEMRGTPEREAVREQLEMAGRELA